MSPRSSTGPSPDGLPEPVPTTRVGFALASATAIARIDSAWPSAFSAASAFGLGAAFGLAFGVAFALVSRAFAMSASLVLDL
jgi:hypothetical protein